MEQQLNFKDGFPSDPRFQGGGTPVPSCLSVKSDRSMDRPIVLKGRAFPADISFARPEGVCDLCPGKRRRAVKFCLTCSASYCETHVRQHYTSPALQRHALVEGHREHDVNDNDRRQLGRFTKEEQDTVKIIQKIFGAESAKYTIVLFTQGDRLKGTSIEEFIGDSKELKEFISQCHGGYQLFNNEQMENRSQVTELLQKIDKMVAVNGGNCYTNEMYKEAEEVIEEEKRRILRENKEKRCREEGKLKAKYEGEALEKARKECKEKYEREARGRAERYRKDPVTCAVL